MPQVLCCKCSGAGSWVITTEMALAAGMPERTGELVVCATCSGNGWVYEIEEKEN